MKKKIIIGVIIAIAFVIVIATVVLININKEKKQKNEETVEQTQEEVISGKSKRNSGTGNEVINQIEASSSSKKKNYMEDYEIIGVIEIPKIDLKSNILNETTKRALEIAITKIYTVNGLNKPGNTVLYGHNYRNSLFFSRNDELENGDKIYITDAEGKRIKYTIYNIFETTSTDTSFYIRTAEMTEGKAEVTLSTCTDDAGTTDRRLIILAKED